MKFVIETLGCKVNSYETNIMIDLLVDKGYEQVSNNDHSDIYIINTCTVTNNADSKSMKIIRQAIKKNEEAIIVVVGCLSQTNQSKVEEIDGVDIILGNLNKTKIVYYIEQYLNNKEKIRDVSDICDVDFEHMQLNNFNKTRAFVKIQDGCNNYCSYCIIPYARGNVRSKDNKAVIAEIKDLVASGHREIVLTGIHTGSYGVDLKNYNLAKLLKDIVKIKDLNRVRISSIEITEIDDEILEVFEKNDKIVNHMHIPLQSGSNEILKLMNRKYDMNYYINKINELRKIRPEMLITTDVIVGFPNESDELFEEVCSNIKKIGFSKLHVFPYSKREGTVAADMEKHVEPIVKKKRVQQLLKLSKELEIEVMNKYLNKEITFIPEVYRDGFLIGHSGNYLSIKAKGNEEQLNQVIKVKINQINYPHCLGNICKE